MKCRICASECPPGAKLCRDCAAARKRAFAATVTQPLFAAAGAPSIGRPRFAPRPTRSRSASKPAAAAARSEAAMAASAADGESTAKKPLGVQWLLLALAIASAAIYLLVQLFIAPHAQPAADANAPVESASDTSAPGAASRAPAAAPPLPIPAAPSGIPGHEGTAEGEAGAALKEAGPKATAQGGEPDRGPRRRTHPCAAAATRAGAGPAQRPAAGRRSAAGPLAGDERRIVALWARGLDQPRSLRAAAAAAILSGPLGRGLAMPHRPGDRSRAIGAAAAPPRPSRGPRRASSSPSRS